MGPNDLNARQAPLWNCFFRCYRRFRAKKYIYIIFFFGTKIFLDSYDEYFFGLWDFFFSFFCKSLPWFDVLQVFAKIKNEISYRLVFPSKILEIYIYIHTHTQRTIEEMNEITKLNCKNQWWIERNWISNVLSVYIYICVCYLCKKIYIYKIPLGKNIPPNAHVIVTYHCMYIYIYIYIFFFFWENVLNGLV